MSHTYGLEFEVIGVDPRQASHAVTRAGVVCNATDYNHETSRNWKALRDGSLPSHSAEIVSPVLEADRLNEIRIVTGALLNAGAYVTKSAGFHTHFGADRIGGDAEIAQLVLNWYTAHSVTELLVAPSRRLNGSSARWCKAIDLQYAERLADNVSRGDYSTGDRYQSLNLEAFQRHGTLEFRLHQGTLNGRKASAWVEFLTAFVNHASAGESLNAGDWYRLDEPMRALPNLLTLLQSHGLSERTSDYLQVRANELGAR